MNFKIKSALSGALAATMLVGCGGGSGEVGETTTASDTTASTVTEANLDPQIEAVDYGGASFRFLTRTPDGYNRQLDDISAEEEDGTHLNDAIYRRNSLVMDKYNLKFETTDTTEAYQTIRTSIASGDDEFDTAFLAINDSVALSADGYVYDLNEIEHIDITKPYWSNAIMNDISIFGHNYVGISNLTTQAFFSTGIFYFNKQLAEDYKLESPYDLVRSGDWTFDKMISLCRDVSKDLNGNNEFDEKDQYGLTFNNFAWQIFFYGGGESFVAKEKDGTLKLDSSNERIINYLQKLMPISQDEEVVLYSENYAKLGGNYRVDVCKNAFAEGRSLFWLEAMYGVPSLRDMEMDFGILPAPKFDAEQEDYASFIHTTSGSSLVVPVTVGDTDRVGRVIEDLTYNSSGVRDAFVEVTLKGKLARDNDSADMIDIIIDSIRTDYALLLNAYGLALDGDMRGYMNSGSTDISSLFASKGEAYESALAKYCDAISANS